MNSFYETLQAVRIGRRHGGETLPATAQVERPSANLTAAEHSHKLMRDTLRATGLKTKREAVEEGLRSLLRLKRQAGIRRLRGKLNWQGDLNAMRSDS